MGVRPEDVTVLLNGTGDRQPSPRPSIQPSSPGESTLSCVRIGDNLADHAGRPQFFASTSISSSACASPADPVFLFDQETQKRVDF
jgi:hypothetical protein